MFTFHACGCACVSGWFWCESISGHPMQKLRSFCRVHNASFYFFDASHVTFEETQTSLWRTLPLHVVSNWQKLLLNSSAESEKSANDGFCFSSNLASNVSRFGILMITTFRVVRSFPCPPSDGNRSPQSVTPHDERAFGFFWANRACHFLKWLIAFIQVLLLHLSRAFVQFPVLPGVVRFSCQKKTTGLSCSYWTLMDLRA